MNGPSPFARVASFAGQFFDSRFYGFAAIIAVLVTLVFWFVEEPETGVWYLTPVWFVVSAISLWAFLVGAYVATHVGTLINMRSKRKGLTQWAPVTFLMAYLVGTYALYQWLEIEQ